MARVLKLLAFLAVALAANWQYVYEEVHTELQGDVQLIKGVSKTMLLPTPTFAGWPFKFFQSVGYSGEVPLVSFNWTALLLNIGVWSSIPIIFLLYEKYFFSRQRRSDKLQIEETSHEPSNSGQPSSGHEELTKPKRRSLQLADMFMATALIAGVFGYWQTLRQRADFDRKLAIEIKNTGGGAELVATLPKFAHILQRIDGFNPFLRVTKVLLINPDDALLAKVVALPYLRTLNIEGGSYDLRTLDRLSTNPLLAELAIVGRPLNADGISSIRSMQSLLRLNLMRTNITSAGLAAIGQPRLLELNLVHTDVQLSELGMPEFSRSLRKIELPHPRKGGGDSLRLEGWPELVELSCYEHDELLNPEPVALSLKNLPKLSSVELDGLQKFDLDFEQLPNLTKLEPTFLQWEQRTTSKQVVPSYLWVGKLRMKDVPQLKSLSVFCADTQLIDIQQASMKLGMWVLNKGAARGDPTFTVMPFGMSGMEDYVEPGYLTHADIPLEIRQKWIDDIAQCSGLESVDLELVPLKDVKLNSLVANKAMRGLKLGKSGLASSRLSELKGMDQLEELSLLRINLDGREIEWLTKTFPKLRRLTCEHSSIRRLRLEHIPNLESLFQRSQEIIGTKQALYESPRLGEFRLPLWIDALQIVDAPKLSDCFEVVVPMLHLHIESAPLISGLSFHEPLPAKAVVKGVQNLRHFAAGGPTCTDAIVNEVLNCPKLQRLTLAYTNLLPATLQRIAELRELDYLVLTGTKVDDSFVASLAGLENLQTLKLEETSISASSVSSICKLKNLEVLDLGNLHLSSQDVSQLVSSLRKLKHLDLAGAELTVENMQQIAKLASLRSLDLSHCDLNDELLNAYAQSTSGALTMLKLNSAKVGDVGFQNVVRQLRSARFALDQTEVNPVLVDRLVLQNRVTEFDEEYGSTGIVWNEMARSYMRIDSPKIGHIDPHRFSPNYKDPSAEFEAQMSGGARASDVQINGIDLGQTGPPMAPFETLGYQLFKILYGASASPSDVPDNLE